MCPVQCPLDKEPRGPRKTGRTRKRKCIPFLSGRGNVEQSPTRVHMEGRVEYKWILLQAAAGSTHVCLPGGGHQQQSLE